MEKQQFLETTLLETPSPTTIFKKENRIEKYNNYVSEWNIPVIPEEGKTKKPVPFF